MEISRLNPKFVKATGFPMSADENSAQLSGASWCARMAPVSFGTRIPDPRRQPGTPETPYQVLEPTKAGSTVCAWITTPLAVNNYISLTRKAPPHTYVFNPIRKIKYTAMMGHQNLPSPLSMLGSSYRLFVKLIFSSKMFPRDYVDPSQLLAGTSSFREYILAQEHNDNPSTGSNNREG